MQCQQCGTQIPDGVPNCPNCGALLNNQYGGNPQPYAQGQPYGFSQKLTKKEFLRHPNLKKTRSNVIASAVILYICAAFTAAMGYVGGNLFTLLDVILLLGLGLGIQLAQSRVCAIVVCIYAVYNVIVAVITTGTFGGWLILIAAIDAVTATFQFRKVWNEYQQTGILPAATK